MDDWQKWIEEEAEQRRKQALADENNPVLQARLAAKRAEDRERGIRLGWLDQNGDPIDQPEDEEPEDDNDQ